MTSTDATIFTDVHVFDGDDRASAQGNLCDFDLIGYGHRIHEFLASRRPLTANSTECLTFRHHRPDDEILAFFQFTLEDAHHFCKRMIRDAKRNLDRLDRVVWM